MNLSKLLIKCIKMMYKHPTSRILVNGALTDFILLKNGVRQGCPLSMLLFGVVVDAFIKSVLKNTHICGFKFGKSKLTLQLCADDITFYFINKDSLEHFVRELIKFKKVSGLDINSSKTELIVNGSVLLRAVHMSPYR